MSEQNIKLTGSELLNPHLDNYNFIATMADGLLYLPNVDGSETVGLAQVKFDAMGGTAPLWKDVRYNLSLQDVTNPDNPIVDFNMLVGLYGVTDVGNVELVGEEVISTPSTTLNTSQCVFDLLNSACHSKFFTTNDTGTADKITLKLPFRTDYIENIGLRVGNYNGWKRYNIFPITGNAAATTYIPVWITVAYDSDMNSDFSDIRFMDWNGNILNHGIVTKTDNSTATFAVQLLTTPSNGVTENLKIWYKNANATSTAIPLNQIYNLWDDFEDGKYTGRSAPYQGWWTVVGSTAISVNPVISGTYSIKHVGAGSGQVLYPGLLTSQSSTSYTLRLNFKLTNQGVATNTPYANLFYLRYVDANNFLRVDTYWNGSAQKIRLYRTQGGSGTTLSEATLSTSKLDTSTVYGFIIRDSGSHCTVSNMYSGTVYINVDYSCTVGTTQKGLGCNQDTGAIWDNIRMYPYITADPLVGTIWGEAQGTYGGTWDYTGISPDALPSGSQQVLFTSPSMDVNAQSYFTYNEYGNPSLTGNKFRINNGGVVKQGYNGLDAYKSLILRFEVDTNSNYTVKVNSAEANYEV